MTKPKPYEKAQHEVSKAAHSQDLREVSNRASQEREAQKLPKTTAPVPHREHKSPASTNPGTQKPPQPAEPPSKKK